MENPKTSISDGTTVGAFATRKARESTDYLIFPVCCLFLFPALGGLLFGYDIGSSSYVSPQLEDENLSGVPSWSILLGGKTFSANFLGGIIKSGGVLGALLGTLIVYKVADKIGRRNEIMIGSLMYLFGAILQSLSGEIPHTGEVGEKTLMRNVGLSVLILGRLVYGIGIGFSMHGAPAYIAEMSPNTLRGILISLKEVFIVVGILLGYGIGYAFSNSSHGWQWMYALSSIVAIFMGLGMYSLPRSARWLALQGRYTEALVSLQFFLKSSEAELSLNQMKTELSKTGSSIRNDHYQIINDEGDTERIPNLSDGITDNDNNNNNFDQEITNQFVSTSVSLESDINSKNNIFSKRYRMQFLVGLAVISFQQLTGQPSVLYYASNIFTDAGFGDSAPVIIGAFKVIATLVAVFTVDKYGRRFLLLLGIFSMFLALLALTFAFEYSNNMSENNTGGGKLTTSQIIVLISMLVYIGGYQIGFGPIAWLLISEIFPLNVRGKAVAVSVCTNFFWNFVITLIYEPLQSAIGLGLTFGIYSAFDLVALVFVYLLLPETKGLQLEEIEAKFMEKTASIQSLFREKKIKMQESEESESLLASRTRSSSREETKIDCYNNYDEPLSV